MGTGNAAPEAWRPGAESNRVPDVLQTSSRPSGFGSGPCGTAMPGAVQLVVRTLGGIRTLNPRLLGPVRLPVAARARVRVRDVFVFVFVFACCDGACPR